MRLAVLLMLFITLAFSDGLNHAISSDNQTETLSVWPCQMSKNINQYIAFISKHILLVDFDTTQLNNWASYLRIMGLCSRPSAQSFLHIEDTYKISKICNGEGTRHSANMCISTEKFIVYVIQVTWINGQCEFKFQIENSYVIVACNVIQDVCLPVHYAGQTGTEPTQRGPICKR